ncbi:unnamed protein product [Ectocarpus sp. CCAP 1310/34]|nr:unnamed protein product [Ectocarpus sp. CCAP 1310/34]
MQPRGRCGLAAVIIVVLPLTEIIMAETGRCLVSAARTTRSTRHGRAAAFAFSPGVSPSTSTGARRCHVTLRQKPVHSAPWRLLNPHCCFSSRGISDNAGGGGAFPPATSKWSSSPRSRDLPLGKIGSGSGGGAPGYGHRPRCGQASSLSSASQSADDANASEQEGTSPTTTTTAATTTASRRPGQVAEPGVVYFVSTPIGNLEDITLRAMNILRTAEVIAAEDTRTTGSLLKLLGVEREGRLVSHHDHNTKRRVPEIVQAARGGKSVAVVSDAGTPGISDPGMELAAACAAEGLRVVPVPGACAAVAAVSVAGFPSHEFVFFGFVSGKRGSAVRRRKLAEIAQEPRTCIMYESPHRIADTLGALLKASCPPPSEALDSRSGTDSGGSREGNETPVSSEAWLAAGCRPVVLARELTKLHEDIFRGTLAEAVARYGGSGGVPSREGERRDGDCETSDGASGMGGGGGGYGGDGVVRGPRGEFTVVLGPRAAAVGAGEGGEARALEALEARLTELTAGGMSTSSAVKMASKDLNLKKSDVYRVALSLQPSSVEKDDG